jgi:hypothetical protein
MAFDGSLFDELLPDEAANITFHLRTVALVSESGKIVCWNYAELADVGKRLHFGSTQ